jgi:hypothetical protein
MFYLPLYRTNHVWHTMVDAPISPKYIIDEILQADKDVYYGQWSEFVPVVGW